MADGRNYTFNLKVGKDGAQVLLIREASPVRRRPARQLAAALAERLNSLRTGFQKALRLASRRA